MPATTLPTDEQILAVFRARVRVTEPILNSAAPTAILKSDVTEELVRSQYSLTRQHPRPRH
jgi:hypothetical protein